MEGSINDVSKTRSLFNDASNTSLDISNELIIVKFFMIKTQKNKSKILKLQSYVSGTDKIKI